VCRNIESGKEEGCWVKEARGERGEERRGEEKKSKSKCERERERENITRVEYT
jgi:hypothetical protein